MIKIIFQVCHNGTFRLDSAISIFYSKVNSRSDINESILVDELRNWFTLESSFRLPNNKYLTKLSLEFVEFIAAELIDDFIREYLEEISKLPNVINIIKYFFNYDINKGVKYYTEIYQIEMDLREIINYILLYNDKVNLEITLKDFSIKVAEKYESQTAKEYFENELFYILFNSYVLFETPKQLSSQEVSNILVESKTFEDFKSYLDGRVINTERHIDFIASIKNKVDTLEKLRNAVMHNRAITNNIENNYLKIKESLRNDIKEFWIHEDYHAADDTELDDDWTIAAKEEIDILLENAEWDYENKSIILTLTDEPKELLELYNINDLRSTLINIGDSTAANNMPLSSEIREEFASDFSSDGLVESALEKYNDNILKLGWL